jgi:hypothetical protein
LAVPELGNLGAQLSGGLFVVACGEVGGPVLLGSVAPGDGGADRSCRPCVVEATGSGVILPLSMSPRG